MCLSPAFVTRGGMMRRHAPERYYHTRVKRGVTGMHDTWLILGGQQWEADRELARETVSLRITGTNGQLPRRALQSTLLDRCESISATPLTVRNLCKPTLPAIPAGRPLPLAGHEPSGHPFSQHDEQRRGAARHAVALQLAGG